MALRRCHHMHEAHLRVAPSGPLLECLLDGRLHMHRRFRERQGAILGERAEAKRQELIGRG